MEWKRETDRQTDGYRDTERHRDRVRQKDRQKQRYRDTEIPETEIQRQRESSGKQIVREIVRDRFERGFFEWILSQRRILGAKRPVS